MKVLFKLLFNKHDNPSKILALLKEVKKSSLNIEIDKEIIRDNAHADALKQILLPISVLGKIRIHQTKGGILYPHLLVYRDGQLSTFYPRLRKGEADVTIEQFLKRVLSENERDNLAVSFYTTGRDCIESAKLLYRRGPNSSNGILITQGIESLLASFIIFKEKRAPLDVIGTLKSYKHEYKKFYDYCQKIDDAGILKDNDLAYIIADLSASFFSSTIDARYPKTGFIRFMPSYFPLLEEKLVKPLGILLHLEEPPSQDP